MMNKAEKEKMEALERRIALRYYEDVEPDIAPPESGGKIINGYHFILGSRNEVVKACTNCVFHGIGRWDETRSQNPIWLYSTKERAYKALLAKMSQQFATEMRRVEREMEKALAGESDSNGY